jgi:gamma-glutamyltranspeptidase
MVSSCVIEKGKDGKVKEKVCCYTSEDGGEELYYAWEAHLTSPEVGYKVRSIEVEGGKAFYPGEITERITGGADVRS